MSTRKTLIAMSVAVVAAGLVTGGAYFWTNVATLSRQTPGTRLAPGVVSQSGPTTRPSEWTLGPMPRGKTASLQWRDRGWAMADRVVGLVSTGEPEQRVEAVRLWRLLIDARPAFLTGTTSEGAIRFLAAKKMYRELIDLADYAVATHPEAINELAVLHRYKAIALGETGQLEQAIVAAMQYYNLAPLAKTDDAVRLLTSVLRKAGPARSAQADQLVHEHAIGKRYDAGPENISRPIERAGVLASIRSDTSVNAAINSREPAGDTTGAVPGDDEALTARGVLLLLQDRPAEAEAAFRSAYESALPKRLADCTDNVARAMRDQDGGVGRAVAWTAEPWPVGAKNDSRADASPQAVPTGVLRPQDVAGAVQASPAVAWLREWESRVAKEERTTAGQVSAFEVLLEHDAIDSDACSRLTRAVAAFEPGINRSTEPFGPVAGVMARAVIARGAREIEANPPSRDVVLARMSPLVGRLWRAWDRDAAAVETFYTTLALGQPVGSPDWTRGHLGRAEAIGRQGRDEESLKALDELAAGLPDADAPLRAKIAYDRAVVYYLAGHFEQAVGPPKAAASTKGFEDAPAALSLLVTALINSGQVQDMAALQRQIDELLPGRSVTVTDALDRRTPPSQ